MTIVKRNGVFIATIHGMTFLGKDRMTVFKRASAWGFKH